MIVLIHGTNNYLSSQRLAELKASNPDANIIDGSRIDSLDEIFVSTDTFSLFGADDKSNMTIVKRLFSNKKKTLIEAFVKKLEKSNVDIIVWEDKEVPKNLRYYKIFDKQGKVEKFDIADIATLKKWISAKLNQATLTCSEHLIMGIIDKVGTDQFALDNELTKLILLKQAQGQSEITSEDFVILNSNDKDLEIWGLMDAMLQKDKKKIIEYLEFFLTTPEKFPYLVAMIARQLKIMYLLMQPGASTGELASKLRTSPYGLSKIKSQLHRFELRSIKTMYAKLVDLDFAIKEGRIEPRLGLNLLLLSI